MIYVLLSLLCLLSAIAFRLNRLYRRELIRANKGEVLIKRLYQRINELEARCYRLRRERYSGDSCGNPLVYMHTYGRNGQSSFVEWPN